MSMRLVVRRIVVAVSLVGGIFLALENLWAILARLPSSESPPRLRGSPSRSPPTASPIISKRS
jgi:hypothetical protein